MQFDPEYMPYPSRRACVYAKKGMVAAQHGLAAQAGLSMLQQGGNAVDAAVAAAAALTVLEPTSNGIGGDAFALVWSGGQLHGLNASGPAPKGFSRQALQRLGLDRIPRDGVVPVTVPGTPAAWVALSRRFGRLPLTTVLSPAIRYAEEGFAVSANVAYLWRRAFARYRHECHGPEFTPWFKTFAPQGRAPHGGETVRLPDHARTLKVIAETEGAAFYRGELAERIDGFMREHGGFLRKEDLETYRPEWVTPISIEYRGYRVWELPPNGHGLVALLALNILKGFDLGDVRESVEAYHKQIEALKLAYADGKRVIADPVCMRVSVEELLSEEYAAERRRLIGKEALVPEPGRLARGGTVYLAAADAEGNMVSYIQSNYMGFGSGIVIPDTGIALHNRGHNFTLEPGHPNALAPGKRPYHTIIPGFLTRGERPVGPFGVMGAFMQPQGHVQVVVNTIDFGLSPQAALDAPRWQWLEGKQVALERGVAEHLELALARRGHEVVGPLKPGSFGFGQIIWRTDDGVLIGGTEPRTDSGIAAW